MSFTKAHWAILSGTLAVLLAGATIYSHLEKDVIIKDGDKVIETSTFSNTVEELLKKKNIALDSEDKVSPALETKLNDKMTIVIKRAFQVKILADGKENLLKTQPDTVENILAKANITLGEKDKIKPENKQLINGPGEISITRVEERILTETKPIPYETVSRRDFNLPLGQKKVAQQGQEGQEEIKTIQILENGEVVSSKVEKTVLKAPKPKIVLTGTVQVASRAGVDFSYTEKRRMTATAYTHTGNRTATGTTPRVGAVAVDPRVIPLGTRLYIEGYGFARAEDTGGAIKGDKIDLFFNTLDEVKRFGRRSATVYILK